MRSNTDRLQPFVPGRSLTPAMTLGRLFLCSLLLVGASSGHVLQAADAARPLRVALMNFTSDDNSYRSTMAAINFTATLQAQLSELTEFEWVERAELDKAESEFNLAGLGFMDRAEAIRGGRWVKADWAITGRFSTNAIGQRTLTLETIELLRADLLDSTTIDLKADGKTPLRSALTEISPCAAMLKELLQTAKARASAVLGRPTVALLFFCHDESVYSTLRDLEQCFRATLEAAATNRSFRLLHLRRARDSVEEAGLTLAHAAITRAERAENLSVSFSMPPQGFFHTENIPLLRSSRKWQES